MKKVFYVNVSAVNFNYLDCQEDILIYFVYKDSVFTTREEAIKMLEMAESDDKILSMYDSVEFEIMEFYVNPLSQFIDVYN